VGDRRGSEVQQQKGPVPPAGPLLTLAVAVVFPFDRVLAGMAAAGHGIAAICLYLGLTRTVLLEHVVRVEGARGGPVITTDGPYAETKEALTGYYLIEAEDLEEAVAIAQNCPGLPHGVKVEVRPVMAQCPLSAEGRAELEMAGANA
jgi:hypothetical protein